MSALGVKAGELASQSVGVMEDPLGSNRGQWVEVYQRFVGIPPGSPWCMAFACYKIHQAAQQLGVKTDWPKSGSCVYVGAWAKRLGRFLEKPEPGCLFLLHGKADGVSRFHHTGIVTAVDPDGTVHTIEGNTNEGGSPEGIGVFARKRAPAAGLKFVRI